MATLIVLFNLRPGVSPDDYERWARETDVPTVKGLASIDDFRVYRSTGLLMGEGAAPYAYTEVIEVNDLAKLGEEVASETMQAIAAAFQQFAAGPTFVLTEQVA